MSDLTIINYHYVRPILGSKFSNIKGLELDGFKRQLDFIEENYLVVSAEQVIEAVVKDKKLTKNACLLTFDDGLKDHYKYVLPELLKRNLSGAFFPASAVIEKKELLNVHSIQHILSKINNIELIFSELYKHCLNHGITQTKFNSYLKNFGVANQWDDANIIFIKRMLQCVLPEETRNSITKSLFKKFVGESELEFSSNLYMNIEEVRELVKKGMYVGCHGSKHFWLDKLSVEKQKEDIVNSIGFLENVGVLTKNWIMSYPHGAYDDSTISLIKDLGASIGITTEPKIANLLTDNPFILPRMDTNDFPQ
tara:strand:+ start:1070 stop:1996 length:927 start_codon:yes stop_codon:yes gene_type:complete